jgi:hypothetical protein
MLSYFVGPVDSSAAFVLVAMFGAVAIVTSVAILNLQTGTQEEHKFQLAVMSQEAKTDLELKRAQHDHELRMAQTASSREIEFKRIDSGMIDLQAVKKANEA